MKNFALKLTIKLELWRICNIRIKYNTMWKYFQNITCMFQCLKEYNNENLANIYIKIVT